MFRLLDVYCCAGGASMGYSRAGFEVVGVDIRPQKRYPFEFIQADALDVLRDTEFLEGFDVVHASPPCQLYTSLQNFNKPKGITHNDRDYIYETRELLEEWGGIYVIENVMKAPLRPDLVLCGTQFGLKWGGRQLQRHRKFESNVRLRRNGCKHKGKPWGVFGSLRDCLPAGGETPPTVEAARLLMGIDWMLWGELCEAIPPVYTEHIGVQLIKILEELRDCEAVA